MPTLTVLRAAALATCLLAPGVQAHEFWLEPVDFQVDEGAPVKARSYVGTMMKGDEYSYISSLFKTFTVTDAQGTRPVEGQIGDKPALTMKTRQPGLHIVAHQSTVTQLRYKTWEKFTGFLKKEGLDWVAEAHKKRGLPDSNFLEGYTRFAKSLIAVGDGAGDDKALGLRLELIALSNPYTDDGPVEVELRFEGEPAPGIQLSVFRRPPEGAVTRSVMRTDDKGRAVIPRAPGVTLLSAVHMVEPSEALATRRLYSWHSLWASLTYGPR